MKKGTKYLLFAGSIFMLLVLLEKAYDFFIEKNPNIKLSYISENKADVDILIHGPCEPNWMLSPAIIDSFTHLTSYNLALNHSDFADNYLHLYLYLKHHKAPAFLFLYVTPESFDERYNTFHTYRFAPYLDDENILSVVKEYDPEYARWYKFPFMKYAYYSGNVNFEALQGAVNYFKNSKAPFYPDGYQPPINRVWDNHESGFLRLYPKGIKFKWSKRREKYLDLMYQLCRLHQVRMVLFESPVLKEAIPFQLNRNLFIKKIQDFAKERQVPYLLFDTLKMADSRKYFISILNTNVEGSEMFSRIFGRYVRDHFTDDSLLGSLNRKD
jgi:hypothetical protein